MLYFAIKSSIVLALLYWAFFALLSKETFHRFNRLTLLFIMIISLILPIVPHSFELPIEQNNEITNLLTSDTEEFSISYSPVIQEEHVTEAKKITFIEALGYLYLSGVAIMLIILVYQLVSMYLYIRRGLRHTDEYGNTVILKPGDIPSFSILHIIVISIDDYEKNRDSILTHEQSHINLGHTYDLILFELTKIIQWFNPFVWMLGRDLKSIHEYEADKAVLNQGIDSKNYQYLLVNKTAGPAAFALINGFKHSQLISRIIMMNKSQSSPMSMARYLVLLPLLLVSFIITAQAKKTIVSSNIDNAVSKEKTTFKGVVKDAENGQPIWGTSIVVNGTTRGTISLQDGSFEIEAFSGETLVFSFVGYGSKEICLTADNKDKIQVNLNKETVYFDLENVPVKSDNEKSSKKKVKQGNDEEPIFTVVEQNPTYPGGISELLSFIDSNLKYPKSAVNNKVNVSFVVEPDGSLSNIGIEGSSNEELTSAIINMVKKMPKWNPGKQRGKAVPVKVAFPVIRK